MKLAICISQMKPGSILVTGSAGLIGSEVASYFASQGWLVIGIDNNQRAVFFGKDGDTAWNVSRLKEQHGNSYRHMSLDIRDRKGILEVFKEVRPNAIVHTAAQPSHDKASSIPFDDFDTNAVGTLNLIEATRLYCGDSPFIHLSTNKVYGDRPNSLEFTEKDLRWDFSSSKYKNGISEDFPIDQSMHSLFGASKTAADIVVQEYGRYFKIPTCCLRGGCLTGPSHSGVQLHGFLSYLTKCNTLNTEYTIYGYKGKQVRDNIHSSDVTRFIELFIHKPRIAEVYNLGGGRRNSCSILEAIRMIESCSGRKQSYIYNPENRMGDHICYISDLSKIKSHYPSWDITISLEYAVEEMVKSWIGRI